MADFEIIKPTIFPIEKIVSGVTKRNIEIFPQTGFSITKGEILSDEEVNLHRKYLAEFLNMDINQLKFQRQVHRDTIRIIDIHSNNKESDGMICHEKGIILNIAIADCVAILLYDQQNDIIAAVHSGWRGTKLDIVSKCINKLSSKYDTHLEELLIYISPCASGEKYEVEEDVAIHFPGSVRRISDKKYQFDNRKEIYNKLLSYGISTKQIETSGECTITNTGLHSYRRDKKKSGRMSAYIGMA